MAAINFKNVTFAWSQSLLLQVWITRSSIYKRTSHPMNLSNLWSGLSDHGLHETMVQKTRLRASKITI